MDSIEELATAGRVTRSLRKRLNSVDVEAGSRPNTPNPSVQKLLAISETTSNTPSRGTRRNSLSTPIKTPLQPALRGTRVDTPDVGTPSRRITRRNSLAYDEDVAPAHGVSANKSQFPTLAEVDDEKTSPANASKPAGPTKRGRPKKNVSISEHSNTPEHDLTDMENHANLPAMQPKVSIRMLSSGLETASSDGTASPQKRTSPNKSQHEVIEINDSFDQPSTAEEERSGTSTSATKKTTTNGNSKRPELFGVIKLPNETPSPIVRSVAFDKSTNEQSAKSSYPRTPGLVSGKSLIDADTSRDSDKSQQTAKPPVSSFKEAQAELMAPENQDVDSSKESDQFHDASNVAIDDDDNISTDGLSLAITDKTPHKGKLLACVQSSTPICDGAISAGPKAVDAGPKNNENNDDSNAALLYEISPDRYLRSGKVYSSPETISPTKIPRKLTDSLEEGEIVDKSVQAASNVTSTNDDVKSTSMQKADQTTTPKAKERIDISPTKRRSEGGANTSNTLEAGNNSFSRSWSRGVAVLVSDKASPKIDAINSSATAVDTSKINADVPLMENTESERKDKRTTMESIGVNNENNAMEQDEPENTAQSDCNGFVMDECEEAPEDYQSGDSMDTNEREMAEDDIEDNGTSIGSEDTNESEGGEEENDSFIASSEEEAMLDYSDYDEGLSPKTATAGSKNGGKSYKRIRAPSSDSDVEAMDDQKNVSKSSLIAGNTSAKDASKRGPLSLNVSRMIDETLPEAVSPASGNKEKIVEPAKRNSLAQLRKSNSSGLNASQLSESALRMRSDSDSSVGENGLDEANQSRKKAIEEFNRSNRFNKTAHKLDTEESLGDEQNISGKSEKNPTELMQEAIVTSDDETGNASDCLPISQNLMQERALMYQSSSGEESEVRVIAAKRYSLDMFNASLKKSSIATKDDGANSPAVKSLKSAQLRSSLNGGEAQLSEHATPNQAKTKERKSLNTRNMLSLGLIEPSSPFNEKEASNESKSNMSLNTSKKTASFQTNSRKEVQSERRTSIGNMSKNMRKSLNESAKQLLTKNDDSSSEEEHRDTELESSITELPKTSLNKSKDGVSQTLFNQIATKMSVANKKKAREEEEKEIEEGGEKTVNSSQRRLRKSTRDTVDMEMEVEERVQNVDKSIRISTEIDVEQNQEDNDDGGEERAESASNAQEEVEPMSDEMEIEENNECQVKSRKSLNGSINRSAKATVPEESYSEDEEEKEYKEDEDEEDEDEEDEDEEDEDEEDEDEDGEDEEEEEYEEDLGTEKETSKSANVSMNRSVKFADHQASSSAEVEEDENETSKSAIGAMNRSVKCVNANEDSSPDQDEEEDEENDEIGQPNASINRSVMFVDTSKDNSMADSSGNSEEEIPMVVGKGKVSKVIGNAGLSVSFGPTEKKFKDSKRIRNSFTIGVHLSSQAPDITTTTASDPDTDPNTSANISERQVSPHDEEHLRRLQFMQKLPPTSGSASRCHRKSLGISAMAATTTSKPNRPSLPYIGEIGDPSQSFVETVAERKRALQEENAKGKRRQSKSFSGATNSSLNGGNSSVVIVNDKPTKAEKRHSQPLPEGGLASSTPYAKATKSVDVNKILSRCDEILEAANQAKLEQKKNAQKNNDAPLPSKSKKVRKSKKATPKLDSVGEEQSSVDARPNAVVDKQKDTKKAVEKALKACGDILLNRPTKKKQSHREIDAANSMESHTQRDMRPSSAVDKKTTFLNGKVETAAYPLEAAAGTLKKNSKKRPVSAILNVDEEKVAKKKLPADILEALSNEETSSQKKRARLDKSYEPRLLKHKVSSAAGEFLELPLTPKRKPKTIRLPTGVMSVESLTPSRSSAGHGFHESPMTPSVAFKVRRLAAGQDEPPENSQTERRKKRKHQIQERELFMPKPQWTQSGLFIEEKLPVVGKQTLVGSTQFQFSSLPSENGKEERRRKKLQQHSGAVCSFNTAALNFKENAIFHANVPRETARDLLQRKDRMQKNRV